HPSGDGEQRIALDQLVVRAFAAKAALVEQELVHGPVLRLDRGMVLEKTLEAGRPAFPPCKRDVRVKRASLRGNARRLAGTLDLGAEGGKFLPWMNACPQGTVAAPLENADIVQLD